MTLKVPEPVLESVQFVKLPVSKPPFWINSLLVLVDTKPLFTTKVLFAAFPVAVAAPLALGFT
jgi:hypothetical protein